MVALVICEKPDQAKSIAHALYGNTIRNENGCFKGKDYWITYAFGHLLTLAAPEVYDPALEKRSNIGPLPVIPAQWKKVVNDKKNEPHLKMMRGLMNQASSLVIGTDSAREGELIAREIIDYFGIKKPMQRLWIQSLDKKTIKDGFANLLPAEKKLGLYMSARAREESDWLFGMNGSRIFSAAFGFAGKDATHGVPGNVTVGRVQSPTLRMIVERDLTIENFKPKTHFGLNVEFQHVLGNFGTKLNIPAAKLDEDGHCVDSKFLESVANEVDGKQGVVKEAVTEAKKHLAPLPYDLSKLQQEGSKRLGISVKQVLDIAQVLYEKHKITTYPRVDCRFLDENMFANVPNIFASLLKIDPKLSTVMPKLNMQQKNRAWNSKKVAESDHHGIMPVALENGFDLNNLTSNERIIYRMIRDRFLLQFAPDCLYDATVIKVECVGHEFQANGSIERVAGWKAIFEDQVVDTDDADKDLGANQKLPGVTKNDSVLEVGSSINDKTTTAPEHFTEPTLLDAMENIGRVVKDPKLKKVLSSSKGLGTSATRAAIIEKLLDPKYGVIDKVKKGKKTNLVSTKKGREIVRLLPDVLTNPETTALWELCLEQIAQGSKTITYEIFMKQQVKLITDLVELGKVEAAKRTDRSQKSKVAD